MFQVLTCLLVVLQFTWREDLFQLATAIWKSLRCMFITSIMKENRPPSVTTRKSGRHGFCVFLWWNLSQSTYIVSFWKCCSSTLRVRVALRDGEHCAWRSKAGRQAGLARVSCLRQKFTSTTTHKVFAFVEYTRGIFFCGWGLCHVWVSWMNLTWLHYDWYGSARSHPVTSTTTNSGKC
jgi:hypothetical protein